MRFDFLIRKFSSRIVPEQDSYEYLFNIQSIFYWCVLYMFNVVFRIRTDKKNYSFQLKFVLTLIKREFSSYTFIYEEKKLREKGKTYYETEPD